MTVSLAFGQKALNIEEVKGRVLDTAHHGVSQATVSIPELDLSTITNSDGNFLIAIPLTNNKERLSLVVSHVGKVTQSRNLVLDKATNINITLLDRSYALPDVSVAVTRNVTANSNSSIVFDRNAIENIQPLSLADIFKYLPGKTVTAPNVMDKTFLTLRSEATTGNYGMNNAFGTAIILDGSAISNNANIQSVNVAKYGSAGTTNQIGAGGNRGSNTNDFANNGIDLRQISVESIESVEVISGVASAKYGDYADGAVIINRQAGKSPWRLSSRVREGTFNFSASKGFLLNKKLGSLSAGFDYLNSNEDPRDNFKSYKRIGGTLAWTYAEKGSMPFRNTLSLDYSSNLDNLKADPDDGNHSTSSFKNYNFRINNRSSWQINKKWLKKIDVTANYSGGRQESYDQVYINTATVRQITLAMETGLHEGYFTPGFYYATRRLIGNPVNASARLELNNYFATGKIFHNILVGGNWNYSGNKGPGLVEDPNTPRFQAYITGVTNRPNSYNRSLYTQAYGGTYVEDRMNTVVFNKPLNMSVGVRGDWQNKFFVVAPRISAGYELSKTLKLNLSYGVASKAPSLLQVNPGDVYYDIPVVSYYTNNPAENYYLAYTQVVKVQNLNLKPYTSYITEGGLNWKNKLLTAALNLFYKRTENGYGSDLQYSKVTLPVYTTTPVAGAKPILTQTGTKNYTITYSLMNNALSTNTKGAELILNTNKIKAIQTSITFNTSYYRTEYYNKNNVVGATTNFDANVLAGRTAVIGVYAYNNNVQTNIKSGLALNTHIPSLRMVVSISADVFWQNKTQYDQSSLYPVGYYTKDYNYVALAKGEGATTAYQYLWRTDEEHTLTNGLPFVYSNWNLRVGKEISSRLRFSFSAYNFMYLKEAEVKTVTLSTGSTAVSYFALRPAPAFGAELQFTL